MKNYFTRLFAYNLFANRLIAELMSSSAPSEKTTGLMAHLIAAQKVWFNRCSNLPAANITLWSVGNESNFFNELDESHKMWVHFLKTRNENDFNGMIGYQNTKGDYFENKLADILAHVINHGTHHRAQIGQQLKFAGLDPLPGTDYILYVRNTSNI